MASLTIQNFGVTKVNDEPYLSLNATWEGGSGSIKKMFVVKPDNFLKPLPLHPDVEVGPTQTSAIYYVDTGTTVTFQIPTCFFEKCSGFTDSYCLMIAYTGGTTV